MAPVDNPADRDKLAEKIARIARVRSLSSPMIPEFRINDFVDDKEGVEVSSMAEIASALRKLVAEKRAFVSFRIVSPTGPGVAEYGQFTDVPDRIEDPYQDGKQVEVTPDMVIPVYKFK